VPRNVKSVFLKAQIISDLNTICILALPIPLDCNQNNHYIAQQLDYDPAREQAVAAECRTRMNPQQLEVYDQVLQC
jgi:hypothetical protein